MGRQLAREYPDRRPTSWCRCRTAATAPRWATRWNRASRSRWRSCATTTSGRSFLQPSQLIRDFDVRVKLNLIDELVKDKRVIVVDDSIVRGTTCKARVNNLKEAGAKEVHVLVSCPPHMNPCVYGIDFPDRSKLMAANHSHRGDPQVSQRRFAPLPLAGGHGESDRPADRIRSAWPVTTAIIPCLTIRR